MTAQLLRLPLGIAIAGLMLSVGTAGQAGQKKGPASVHVPIIVGLHQTHVLLQVANRDYDGFRAKAAHQVHRALQVLDPHHKHHPKVAGAVVPPPGGEIQAKSDAQLKQAGQQLQVMLSQLSSLPATDLHAAEAIPHVRNAIAEINTALQIR